MAEYRPGWRRVQFSQMVTSAGATRKSRGWTAADSDIERYVGLEHLDSNSLRIRRWGDPSEVGANSDLRHFEPGDVLLARRGIELRKVGLAHFRGVASGHALVFRARPEVVLPNFLPYFIQSNAFMKRADRRSVGSLSKTVNLSALMKEEFLLPSLDEQARTVRLLADARAMVEACFDALTALDRAKDAAIARALETGLRGAPLLSTPLGTRPTNWQVCSIEARYDVQLGKMISSKTRGPGIRRPYLRNANIMWGGLLLDDVLEMNLAKHELDRYELREGDILACEGRHVGKSAIWRGEIEGACYQKALHRLRRRTAQDLPEFMLHTLRYYSVAGRLLRYTTGTTIPHLPLANLRAIQVAFPPLNEQEEIVEFVDQFETSRTSLQRRFGDAQAVIAAASKAWESR